jgi:hypothetical protein
VSNQAPDMPVVSGPCFLPPGVISAAFVGACELPNWIHAPAR